MGRIVTLRPVGTPAGGAIARLVFADWKPEAVAVTSICFWAITLLEAFTMAK